MFGLILLTTLYADPVPILEASGPTVVEVGKKCVIKVQTTAKKVTWRIPVGVDTEALDGRRLAVWANPGTYVFTAMVPNGDDVASVEYVLTVTGARPPPGPIPPGPTPTPQPVTSFRVFLTFESGQTITPAQSNVMYGNVVEEYLNANCTGGKAGWRRRDRSLGGENDPTMAALWSAIQPKLTTVPAVAVEVNGRVEIIPLEATPAQMVATLDKYKKGVK